MIKVKSQNLKVKKQHSAGWHFFIFDFLILTLKKQIKTKIRVAYGKSFGRHG